MCSWRTASVALLSFSSGLPLGLVWIAIPDWMRKSGVDLRVVGLVTLAQAPWSFKVLWSPLMDRYTPRWLGRRRGWIVLTQIALFTTTLMLAGVSDRPDAPWIIGALALAVGLAAASQDIVVDAYAVDVLRPEEQGIAVGARVALYRAAMYVAGSISITLAGLWSWPAVCVLLALLYIPMILVAVLAPEPERKLVPPRTLREAVWLPFLGFLSKHRALEILAFVICYKLADNLAQSLQRPFLVDMGYNNYDRGLALGTVGLIGIIVGTVIGGALSTTLGLGHSLWLFGILQIFSNLGYVFVAGSPINRPLMYGAMAFENLTTGMGTGAFSVLLLRLTQKRFSATQYALFSSVFSLPRVLAGPIAGYAAFSFGWSAFYWATMLMGIPGLILLQRFVPLGVRDPALEVEPARDAKPLARAALIARGVAGFAVALVLGALAVASVKALAVLRAQPGTAFDLWGPLGRFARPVEAGQWAEAAGLVIFALCVGVFAAAVAVARSGARDGAELEQ